MVFAPRAPAAIDCREPPLVERRCARRAATLLALLAAAACGPRWPDLRPVALPDLSRMDAAVQAQARERYDTLADRLKRRDVAPAELAEAFGGLGMLLDAAEQYDAAEPCYLNAQTLAPGDFRWPYYLAHLSKAKGETVRAEQFFKRALELRPDDFPALIWLGRLEADAGRPDEAEPLFQRALTLVPRSVPALAGLGAVALARRDYASAVSRLEQALAIDPQADSLHAPLAAAYRGLGQPDRAEEHQRRWKNREILVPDPLRRQLDLLLESGLSYELRGVRALEAKDWAAAAGFFRRGLELTRENTPLRRSLQHKLGTALFMTGQVAEAERQFAEVARASPPDGIDESSAKAHYSLGVLAASRGGPAEAIAHFKAAVRYQPAYVEAQLALADALRRSGQPAESLGPYAEAVRLNPQAAPARLGYAIALSSLRRDREARDWLAGSIAAAPDHPEYRHALARLLAASPDPGVRDGRRARAIVDDLLRTEPRTTDLGETLAMALAEVGDFEQAAAVQRDILAAAARAGMREAVRRMTSNLHLYERRQPCRTPWRPEEVFVLPSPVEAVPPGAALPASPRSGKP